MPESIADRFIAALRSLESNRDLNTITGLFGANAEIGNVIVSEKFHGRDGAQSFWTKYRDTFDQMHSTFRNEIVGDDCVVLEWTTEGTTKNSLRCATKA